MTAATRRAGASRSRSRSWAGPPPLLLQDPVASLRRQIRNCSAWLPAGWQIVACYWDVESGGHRPGASAATGRRGRPFADAGIPRDGGIADLLSEAKSPTPQFACGGVRGYRASAPGHVHLAETGKRTTAIRASRYSPLTSPPDRGDQCDHCSGPPDQAGRRGMVPAAAERQSLERAERTFPGRLEHRHCPLRLHRASGSRTPTRPRPPKGAPRPGWSPTRYAGRSSPSSTQWRVQRPPGHADYRRPADRRPGHATRRRARTPGGPPPRLYHILANPKYTGYMVLGRRRAKPAKAPAHAGE